MTRRGRPSKPTRQKQLEGNPGKRPLNAHEPEATGRPIKPRCLDAEASKLWDFVFSRLVSSGVAKAIDTMMLQSMCELWSLYRKSVTLAKKDPTNKNYRIAVTTYWAKFEVAASKFGMDPAARARLQIPPGDDGDGALQEFGIVG